MEIITESKLLSVPDSTKSHLTKMNLYLSLGSAMLSMLREVVLFEQHTLQAKMLQLAQWLGVILGFIHQLHQVEPEIMSDS